MKLSVALSSQYIYHGYQKSTNHHCYPRCQGTREAYGQSLRNRSDNLEESQAESIGGKDSKESVSSDATLEGFEIYTKFEMKIQYEERKIKQKEENKTQSQVKKWKKF